MPCSKRFLFVALIVWIHSSPLFLEGKNICLTLIVKNEETTIEQCLDSVKDIIDCICVCDAGSTDRTIQIIEQFMQETGIPGKIYQHELEHQNFGYNKTLAIQNAQKTLKEYGFSLPHSYLLSLDSNMHVKVGPAFNKDTLNEDGYLILEKSSILSYYNYNLHLLRASLPWKSMGLIHEYWVCENQNVCVKLQNLSIEDLADTNYDGKLKQDIGLLTQAIKDEPDNARYMFYLAQSHKSLKQYDQAIQWYKSCIEKEKDKEELWFSKYMIGECYDEIDEWEQALYWYLEAYQSNPDRAESLRKIATYYRHRGHNDLAYLFAKYGSCIPYPDNQILFNSSPLYDYEFDQELSISAYYTRFKEDGFSAANDVILRKNVPWYIKNQTYKNILFYVQPLINTRFQSIDVELPFIEKDSEERYHPMNPSIQKVANGYKVICRAVNYTQSGAKIFNTIDSHGVFRTKNFLIDYDQEFVILSQKEITENLPRERIRAFNLEGLDDCRIFEFNKNPWFTCTTCDTNPTGNFQISLCKLDDKSFGKTAEVEQLIPLSGPDPYRCEKNWLPFIKDGSLHVVYSCDPFIIYKPNIETGECETFLEYQPTHDFSSFRGSAAPIEFDDGYLMLVHEVVHFPDYSRAYMHRFLYLDKKFIVKLLSRPFTFKHIGVEFCCSMILDHFDKELIIPIGIEDQEAYLCFIDLDTVRSLLNPLPPYVKSPFQN